MRERLPAKLFLAYSSLETATQYNTFSNKTAADGCRVVETSGVVVAVPVEVG